MLNSYLESFASQLKITKDTLKRTIDLLDGGATVPFIARYRKEITGGLTDEQLFELTKWIKAATAFENRKAFITEKLKTLPAWSSGLKVQLDSASTLQELEDIYLPYKEKKKTLAQKAREHGLEVLAKQICTSTSNDFSGIAQPFISAHYADENEVLQGARYIIAQEISENVWLRKQLRDLFFQDAVLYATVVKSKMEEAIKYKDYFNYHEKIKQCVPHRFLAMMRGRNEKFLRLKVSPEEKKCFAVLNEAAVQQHKKLNREVMAAMKETWERILQPSFENETITHYKTKADVASAKIFSNNLRQLLLAPPLGQKPILAIDPGFKSGCKVVCLDRYGTLMHNENIYPHAPQHQTKQAYHKITTLVNQYKIEAIAIGDGTAGRETEQFIQSMRFERKVQLFIINEDGASVYSASPEARKEFPDYDVTVRGAVSIGRRLMDPLAELIKIDPKSLGIGQYQHDVDEALLEEELNQTIEHCVNTVGVNLNTASEKLLTHVSGIGPTLAKKIVETRSENGFETRDELKKIKGFGNKAFEQSAGFLRILNGKNPLDNSAVHPERYTIVNEMARHLKVDVVALIGNEQLLNKIDLNRYVTADTGLPTLNDVLNELAKPGRDKRGVIKIFEFDKSIRQVSDLKEGMVLPGMVTNITNFGAFVDVGIKQDGLVHISQLRDGFTSDVAAVIKLNQHVNVKVLSVDETGKRIQFSMKGVQQP
jgi:uncharacterized protein